MKSFLIYLAGLATPIIALRAFEGLLALESWRAARRYARAWSKLTVEFANLTPDQLAAARARWDEQSYRFAQYSSDRDRYFAMRWNHGLTTEKF